MATNPLLALYTRTVDTATPIHRFSQRNRQQLESKRQREQEERIINLREQQLDEQIIQNRFERETETNKRRIKNNAIDSLRLKNALDTGGKEGALAFLEQNRSRNDFAGLDSSETDQAIQLLQSDNLNDLNRLLDNNIMVGEALGIIKTPEVKAPETRELKQGDRIVTQQFNPATGKFEDIAEARRFQPQKSNFTARNVLLPNGEKVAGRTTDSGQIQIMDNQGNFSTAPRGAQIISTSLQGSETEIGVTDPEIRNFRQLEAGLPVVQRLQTRVSEGLSSNEFVGGVSGSTVELFNSLRNQVSQLHNAFNKDKPEGQRDVELSIDKHRETLGKATNVSNKVKSGILDLAYMTLKAKGEQKISDQDIRLELKSFGLDSNDPQVIMNRVNEKVGDLFANYRATAQGIGMTPRFEFEQADLDRGNNGGELSESERRELEQLRQQQGATNDIQAIIAKDPEDLTDEEIRKLDQFNSQ